MAERVEHVHPRKAALFARRQLTHKPLCFTGECCTNAQCSGNTPICDDTRTCVACSAESPCPDGCCQADGACGGTCFVFATSSSPRGGDLGGLTGADGFCQGLAEAASLPGRFLAWLSDETDAPSTRFPLAGSATAGPYVLLGTPAAAVAANWTALTARATCESGTEGACLDHPIDRDQTGAALPIPMFDEFFVWSHTNPDGTSLAGTSCDGWTGDGFGRVGFWNKADASWTDEVAWGCGSHARVYCFQQG